MSDWYSSGHERENLIAFPWPFSEVMFKLTSSVPTGIFLERRHSDIVDSVTPLCVLLQHDVKDLSSVGSISGTSSGSGLFVCLQNSLV